MADPEYTIIVGSHCLGTVETRDVTREELVEVATEMARRQWGRPLVLRVYDDAEARPDDDAIDDFYGAVHAVQEECRG